MEAAALLDRLGEISERQLRQEVEAFSTSEKLFILCPNHHKMLDYGSLRFEWNAAGNLIAVIGSKSKRLTNKHVTRPPTVSS